MSITRHFIITHALFFTQENNLIERCVSVASIKRRNGNRTICQMSSSLQPWNIYLSQLPVKCNRCLASVATPPV